MCGRAEGTFYLMQNSASPAENAWGAKYPVSWGPLPEQQPSLYYRLLEHQMVMSSLNEEHILAALIHSSV